MSDLTIESRPPITVTIAPSDPVLAGVVAEFAATLNFLSAQVAEAANSVSGKVSQSQLTDLSDLVSAVRDAVTTLEAVIATKAAADHTQPISSVTGLDEQLGQIAQQLLALQGGEDLANQIAALQAQISAKAEQTALAALDLEFDGLDDNLQALSQALAGKANATHGHNIAAIDGLQAALDAAGSAAPASANLVYTVTQSSVDAGHNGTYAKLTDGSQATGAATGNGSNEWIQFDLGAVKFVDFYRIPAGTLTGWGAVSTYTGPARAEVSLDGSSWILLRANHSEIGVPNVSDRFNASRRFRYLRLTRAAYLALIEFSIFGY